MDTEPSAWGTLGLANSLRKNVRLFYLTTEFPYPPISGGRVRSLAQLKLLASLPEVTELSVQTLTEEALPDTALGELGSVLPRAQVLPPVFHPIHVKQFPHYLPLIAALRAGRLPYLAGKWVSPRIALTLRRHLRSPKDVVYVDHLGMGVYFSFIRKLQPTARIVLEQHNVESDFFKQLADRQTNPVKRLVASQEWRAARRFEERTMRDANSVVAISDSDAQVFSEMGVRAQVIPQVVTYEQTDWTDNRAPRLVYVGNLGWHPNVEGLDWFCSQVWPLVRAQVPNAELDIAGSGLGKDAAGRPKVPTAWQVPGVRVVGFTQDLERFYQGAVGFLAPILGGSGVRIKVLEAFRGGMPLVTTTAGALGLPIRHGEHAMVADTKEAYAKSVAELCQSSALQRRLRDGGYEYLKMFHSLQAAQGVMRQALGIS